MIRGDFEVNESKLCSLQQVPELAFANDAQIRDVGCVPGFASPLGLDPKKITIVVDKSVAGSSNLVVGANEEGYHYRNFNYGRDLDGAIVADIACVREGDPCPVTGEPLLFKHGIEVGNIFQLGTKYSEPMGLTYLDQDGKSQTMIMGCYGIGIGRTMASVVEESHDEFGPIWPMSIAPYQIQVCALNPEKNGVADVAEKLCQDLEALGLEVLYDDRGEKAGAMFKDADLIGIPFRLTVTPKSLDAGGVEFKIRGEKDFQILPLADLPAVMAQKVKEELARYC